jgi:tetratricopeptide (TPR) repeat protein/DNA-binding CsgD family transcriptional regulator
MKRFVILLLLFPLMGISQSLNIDSLMQTISNIPAKEQVTVLMDFGKKYCNANPRISITLVENALAIAEKTDDPLLISNVLNGLAITNYLLGDNVKALSHSLRAIECVLNAIEQYPDSTFLLDRLQTMYSNTNSYYKALGDFEKSLRMLQEASKISDTLIALQPDNIQNIHQQISIDNNIAILNWNLGNTEKALNILNHALKKSRENNDLENMIITLNNIGVIQIDKEQYQEAITTYKQVNELAVQMNDSISLAYSYNNLGKVMENLDDMALALSYFLKAYYISNRLGFSIGLTSSCSNIADVYSKINKPDSAMYFVHLGIDEATRSGDRSYLLKSYETLFRIQEKMGNSDEALEAYKYYVAVKDSIFNAEKSKQIAEMEARFESEKKEKQNQILRTNIEIQQRNSLLLIISLAAFILISLLLYYFYRLKNQAFRQQAELHMQQDKLQKLETLRLEDQLFAEQQINKLQNEKLEQKNRELSTRVLLSINKTDAINKIINELDNIRDDQANNFGNCYEKIKQIANNNLSLEKEWSEFKLHFEEVNPGFFYNLQANHPELTQNEQKLCAYYRINLDTKEIARMLNVTPSAVQKSRHRLRKKMSIPSEIELPEFMGRF